MYTHSEEYKNLSACFHLSLKKEHLVFSGIPIALYWISLTIEAIVFYQELLIENLFEKWYKQVLAGKEY